MLQLNDLALQDEHRRVKVEYRQWREDIARWREEHGRIVTMLKAVNSAWAEAEAALDEHARQIRVLQEHTARQEQMLFQDESGMDLFDDEPMVPDHQHFQLSDAEVRKAHERIEQLYLAVAAEVLELLKLTHPDAVVLETN